MSKWTRTDTENPNYICRICQSPNVVYCIHEDNEGHEDIEYQCLNCKRVWWAEGTDY